MYKSTVFTIIAVLTFVILSVIVYFQFEEMKTYGLLYSVMEEHP
jgi:hypothetical protein